MATAVDASLANDDAQRRATIMSNLTASPTPVGGFFLPEAVLREMLAFFSLDELLVLEDVDVLWREAIAASGAWARISVRHEQDASKVERLVTRVATRHGRETRYLEIVNCALTNSVLVEVGHHFTNVQQLIVSGCKGLGDDGFCSLVSASRATIVEIRAVRCPMLTDAALVCANAHHAESLESVDFSHCRFVTSSGVSSLVQNASRLAYVGLKGCPKVNDSAVAAVTLHCSKVKTLLLGGSGVISDASLRAIADNCSQLETLDIARSNPFGIGRGGVSDDGLNYLASKCANIQQLILRGQGRLSSASLVSLPANCTRLQTLDIGGCRGIVQDPAVLCGVLKRISQLEKLSVSFCGGMVEEHHVSSIASECRTLKTFEVDGETIVAAASS